MTRTAHPLRAMAIVVLLVREGWEALSGEEHENEEHAH